MEVKISYYGMIAETLGKQDERLNIPEESKDIRLFMNRQYPVLQTMTYAVAINQEMRDEIEAGESIQEIALLPPFAGG